MSSCSARNRGVSCTMKSSRKCTWPCCISKNCAPCREATRKAARSTRRREECRRSGRRVSMGRRRSGSVESASERGRTVDEAIEIISATHRRLAAMMRATAPGAPHRLERDGLINAIQTMLEQDFQHAFDEIDWCVSEETAARIDESISPAIAELIFAAVQEALRNAARHARGADVHRHLRLTFRAAWNPCDP